VQPHFLGYCLATAVQATVIDVLLEASRVASLTVHTGQLFGERSTTTLTLKSPSGKVQEGALAPDVQVAHTAFLAIMDLGGNLTTTRADGYLIPMDTVKVKDLLLPALLDLIPYHGELRQIQQLAERNFCNLMDDLPCLPCGGAGGVLQRLDNSRQQGYTSHVRPPLVQGCFVTIQFCTKGAFLSSLPH
jgi:hypothetical protein